MFPKGPYDVNEAGAGSEEPGVRRRFVKRVSGFVSLQLVFVAIIVAVCISSDDIKQKLEKMPTGCALDVIFATPAVLLVVLWPYARHGCIGVTCILWQTFWLAAVAGCQSTISSSGNVLLATSIVAIITLTFACISACTNFDITKYRGFVVVFLWIGIVCFVILVLLNIGKPDCWVIELVLAIVGTLVFSVLLLYHVQTIMGRSVVAVKPDEVIYAMTQLHLALVLIYVCLLVLKLL